jgi:cytochrome c556
VKATIGILAGAFLIGVLIAAACFYLDADTMKRVFGTPHPKPGDVPPVKDVMVRGFRGEYSPIGKIGKELALEPVPWNEVSSNAGELHQLARKLATLQPNKGSPESWRQHTDEVIAWSESLQAAAQRKDVDTARMVQKQLADSCKECHEAHR